MNFNNPYQSIYGNPYYNGYSMPNYGVNQFGNPNTQPQQNNASTPQQTAQTTLQYPSQTNIEYVNGIEGVKMLVLPPNYSKLVLDSEARKFYIKTTDAWGKPTIQSFDYSSEQDTKKEKVETKQANYVTVEAFNKMQEQFIGLQKEFEKLKVGNKNTGVTK